MKIAILPLLPNDREHEKDQTPEMTVCGSMVYQREVLKALLQYGTFDRYYILRHPSQPASLLPSQRAYLASTDDLPPVGDADDVVVFDGQPAIYRLAAWRNRLAFPRASAVGTTHSMHGSLFTLSLMRLLTAANLRPYDALICPSGAGKAVIEEAFRRLSDQLHGQWKISPIFRPQLPIIPLGVHVKQFQGLSKDAARQSLHIAPDAVVALYLGRFSTAEKCDLVPIVVSFCKDVYPRFRNAKLILAGDDTLQHLAASLRNVAGQLHCGDAVLILPNVSRADKGALLAAVDIFYSPVDNVQETFGITLIEAMAAGLPVLASDWNGYREIVHHGNTGFLVPTYTVPTEGPDGMFSTAHSLAATTVVDTQIWTRYACELFANADLRARLGNTARRWANSTYDWPQVIKQYERLWHELFNYSRTLPQETEAAEPPGFDSITLELMFAHYGTSHLAEQIVEVNPSLVTLVAAGHIKQALFEPKGLFDDDLMAAIISVAQTYKQSTVSELVKRVSRRVKRSQTAIHLHIARLVKFGFLHTLGNAPVSWLEPSLAESIAPHTQTSYVGADPGND